MYKLFTEWLNEEFEKDKDNLLAPKLDDRQALLFLKNYLLGEDWYVVFPITNAQANVELVHDILYKYSKKYKKEYKTFLESKGE